MQSVNVRKGPYFADQGDFASAGAVGIDYVNRLPKNLAEITFGSFGYRRGLAAGSTAVGEGTLLAASRPAIITARGTCLMMSAS